MSEPSTTVEEEIYKKGLVEHLREMMRRMSGEDLELSLLESSSGADAARFYDSVAFSYGGEGYSWSAADDSIVRDQAYDDSASSWQHAVDRVRFERWDDDDAWRTVVAAAKQPPIRTTTVIEEVWKYAFRLLTVENMSSFTDEFSLRQIIDLSQAAALFAANEVSDDCLRTTIAEDRCGYRCECRIAVERFVHAFEQTWEL